MSALRTHVSNFKTFRCDRSNSGAIEKIGDRKFTRRVGCKFVLQFFDNSVFWVDFHFLFSTMKLEICPSRRTCAFMILCMLADQPYSVVTSEQGVSSIRLLTKTSSTPPQKEITSNAAGFNRAFTKDFFHFLAKTFKS